MKKFNKIRLDNFSINHKLLLMNILCLIIPLIIINSLVFERISSSVREREADYQRISLERIQSSINRIVSDALYISETINASGRIYKLLSIEYPSDLAYQKAYYETLRSELILFNTTYSTVSKINVFVDNPTIISGGNYYDINQIRGQNPINEKIIESDWYRKASLSTQDIQLIGTMQQSSNLNDSIIIISLLRRIKSLNQQTPDKEIWLKIDLQTDLINKIIREESKYYTILVTDPSDKIMILNDQNKNSDYIVTQEFDQNTVDNKKTILSIDMMGSSSFKGWKIKLIADNERLNQSLRQTALMVTVFGLISIFLSQILIVFVAKSINSRVKKLSSHMKELERNDFSPVDILESRDEIGILIKSYNFMVYKIKILIQDVYKLEIQKRDLEIENIKTELNYLQSQMDPHFLFNTLNAILVESYKKGYDDIVDVIEYLSKLYRRLLNIKQSNTTIEDEISFVRMYLYIEKFRFESKFSYSIQVDESALICKIPKMSIQTLVENSCIHGIQNKNNAGKVEVKVKLNGDYLNVIVHDNGIGIEKNRLEAIMISLDNAVDDKDSISIGIKNVYRRLKLIYGNKMSFEINSANELGTTVSFSYPVD